MWSPFLRLFCIGIIASVGWRSSLFAHDAGDDQTTTGKAEQTQQTTDDDLDELSAELESAGSNAKTKATASQSAAKTAQESYADRARRQALELRDRLTKDPKWLPTHAETLRFEVGAPLTNMCLDDKGRILACCRDQKIRVFSQQGKLVDTIELTFAPEAIGLRESDHAVFVAGSGHLVRLGADLTPQKNTAFPLPPTKEEIEKAYQDMAQRMEAQFKQMAQMAQGLKKQVDDIKKKLATAKPTAQETAKIAKLNQAQLFAYVKGLTSNGNEMTFKFKEDTPLTVQLRVIEQYIEQLGGTDIDQQRQRLRRQVEQQISNSTFTGLAVSDQDLFVVCSGPAYSYDVWRMDHDFAHPKKILSGLRGCCGQLDCQAHDGKLWIAMNTLHKVCCYDRDGSKLSEFGRSDREAADGFGGCCEPKNLRFSADGNYIYCAQSGPPVCVKRFTLDGKFLDVVCFPIYKTGCVRVAVDVSGDTFFMMSPNENAIYVFKPES